MTVQRKVAASPARVYEAWLDPVMLQRFMLPCEGGSVPEAVTDPRVGGAFRIVMRDAGKDTAHTGTYLDLTPHQRLVFTWHSPHSVEGSVVTLTLTPEGEDTLIELRQDRFASEGARDGHRKGWTMILAALVVALA